MTPASKTRTAGTMSDPKLCAECGIELGYRNTSGLCRRHYAAKMGADPENQRKAAEALRNRFYADPEFRRGYIERARALSLEPDVVARRSRRFTELEIWKLGSASQKPGGTSRKLAARSCSDTRMAWCPPHLRERYRGLKAKHGMTHREARDYILAQERAERQRWINLHGDEPESRLNYDTTNGSRALLAAIRREHPERFAA